MNGSSICGEGYWYFSAPKYNSYRIIEISDELAEILCREKKRQERSKEYYNVDYQNYSVNFELTLNCKVPEIPTYINKINSRTNGANVNFICVRDNGTFITPRTLQYTTMIIKKEITEKFDYHSLRHTHASMLAEFGVDQKYIQTRLGHSDVCTTFDVYEHTTEIMRNRGRSALNTMFKL